ncbi:MAG: T9SS type A sorting domain-containing protein, partial [Bacteroidota bacterium]|nr:T9SS type A sorting domain-containing protein [Bacteroidota bacterium]
VERVQVQPVDPYSRHTLLHNEQSTAQTFPLIGCWSLVNGTMVTESITIPAYGSVVLQKESDDSCGLTTGTEEVYGMNNIATSFHPNPVRSGSDLFLKQPSEKAMNISLIDMTGREMQNTSLPAGATVLPVSSHLPAGMYVLRMRSAMNVDDQRLVIE